MKPGLQRNLDADTYHAIDALSASKLKQLAQYPPEQVRYDELHPKDPTPAMAFGTLLHTAVLEPQRFDDCFAVAPTVVKRGPKNLAVWAEFEAANAGKVRTSQKTLDLVRTMRDAAYRNAFVRSLLTAPGGVNEGSVMWVHPTLGVPCKLRFDRLIPSYGGSSIVIDLKTAADASREAFRRACWNQGYYLAAPWYLDGLSAVAPAERQYIWIAQDKEPPHLCAVYQPTAKMLDRGRKDCDRLARIYAHCLATDTWPGYTANGVAEAIDLPPWVKDDPNDIFEVGNADDGKSMEINW